MQLLATGVYNYDQFDYGVLCISDETQRDVLLNEQLLLVLFDLAYCIASDYRSLYRLQYRCAIINNTLQSTPIELYICQILFEN